MPGSALPKDTWFTRVHFDKWAHAGVFAVLLFLCFSAFRISRILLFVLAVLYGIGVEIIQKNWVLNRDFDLYDVLADAAGALIGWAVWYGVYKKNKPL